MAKARINHQIKAPELRVITAEGENLGVMATGKALTEAKERGLDLIEISPNANPPVAKITDYGKYLYDEKKKDKESKTRARTSELRTIQIKIGTGEHDLELKAKKVSGWLADGDRVKIDLYLIGRSKYMDFSFLKGRLERIMKLITVEYKVSQEPMKGPKGVTVMVERK
ncbi:MAG: translation initiation factor IF-3 [Patescibacteria group bacterium]|nr:translation initiation factor IF-3 [Patescibacteria group bacterium]MDE2232681.1 translation initiation factor IF-3 [Patescibacteria group bacterium]